MQPPIAVLGRVLADRGGIGGELDGGVVFVGGTMDEDVLLAVEQVVVGDKALLLVEERAHESHVVEVAAVGGVQQRVRKILHSADEVVVMQEMAVGSFLLVEGAVTQHDFVLELEILRHLRQPQLGGGLAVRRGEQDVVVAGALDAHGNGHLLASACRNRRAQIHNLDVRVAFFVFFDGMKGIFVAGAVVDNDDFKESVLLFKKIG